MVMIKFFTNYFKQVTRELFMRSSGSTKTNSVEIRGDIFLHNHSMINVVKACKLFTLVYCKNPNLSYVKSLEKSSFFIGISIV